MTSSLSGQVQRRTASNSSGSDQHHSTPPTSNEELRVGPSRAHFQKHYYAIKPLGAGANGETFLAISKKATERVRREDISRCIPEGFFNALRAKVVVAKFPKRGRGTDDLDDEIDFLAAVLPKSARSASLPICKPLQYHRHAATPWLTLSFMKGGDLCSFIKRHRGDLTLGFRWHVAFQLTEAMSYVFFGKLDFSDDAASDHDGLVAFHGDLHTGNILLTSSSEGSYRDFPDVKLADFGKARQYIAPTAPFQEVTSPTVNPSLASVKRGQDTDCKSAAGLLLGMCVIFHHGTICKSRHCISNCGKCPRADCETCVEIAQRHGSFDILGRDERLFKDKMDAFRNFPFCKATRAETIAFLAAVAKTARAERDRHYVPLSAKAKQFLDAEIVSDGDIDQALGLSIFGSEA